MRIEEHEGYPGITRYPVDWETVQFGYRSTYNPDSKWDWYSLGGRWRGFWPVRPGTDPEMWYGSDYGGTFDSTPTYEADVVRKGDIDFDRRLNRVTDEAEGLYSKFEQLATGLPTDFTPWSDFYARAQANELTFDEARRQYNSQPIVKRMREEYQIFGLMSSPDDFFFGQENAREKFVGEQRAGAFSTFALLDSDGWHEKGEMGWWGMVSDEKDERSWGQAYQEKIDSLPDSAWLLNYDLHI